MDIFCQEFLKTKNLHHFLMNQESPQTSSFEFSHYCDLPLPLRCWSVVVGICTGIVPSVAGNISQLYQSTSSHLSSRLRAPGVTWFLLEPIIPSRPQSGLYFLPGGLNLPEQESVSVSHPSWRRCPCQAEVQASDQDQSGAAVRPLQHQAGQWGQQS